MKSWLILLCLFPCLISMQSSPDESRLRTRLENLTPDDPGEYFRLGEDFVDIAESSSDLETAIRMFVLSDHLNPVMYRRSSILAIRPLVDDLAVQRLLDANLRAASLQSSFLPDDSHWLAQDEEAIIGAVDALSAFRNGDEKKFRQLLASDGVSEVLEANLNRLPGDVEWMFRRLSQKQGREGVLQEDDQVSTLELQAELLGSPNQPWSVVLRTGEGRPVTVIDPIPLSEIFGIATDRVRWIDGQWAP